MLNVRCSTDRSFWLILGKRQSSLESLYLFQAGLKTLRNSGNYLDVTDPYQGRKTIHFYEDHRNHQDRTNSDPQVQAYARIDWLSLVNLLQLKNWHQGRILFSLLSTSASESNRVTIGSLSIIAHTVNQCKHPPMPTTHYGTSSCVCQYSCLFRKVKPM
jgi:hypothetical protein